MFVLFVYAKVAGKNSNPKPDPPATRIENIPFLLLLPFT